jgi:hypothetical protein
MHDVEGGRHDEEAAHLVELVYVNKTILVIVEELDPLLSVGVVHLTCMEGLG